MIPKSPQFHERHDGHDQMQPDISLVSHKSPEIIKKSPEIIKKSPEIIEKSPEIIKESPEIIKKSPEIIKKSPESHQKITRNHQKITRNHQTITRNHQTITRNHQKITRNHQEITRNHHQSPWIPAYPHESPWFSTSFLTKKKLFSSASSSSFCQFFSLSQFYTEVCTRFTPGLNQQSQDLNFQHVFGQQKRLQNMRVLTLGIQWNSTWMFWET